MVAGRTSGPYRARYVVAGVVGWAIFVIGWARVFADDPRPFTTRTILLLVAFAIAVFLVTALWVRHNKAIYRRRGPRTAVPEVHFEYRQDRVGRPLRLDPEALAGAREIIVRVTAEGTKVYEAAPR